jgi:AcrR family transcriptional regulator
MTVHRRRTSEEVRDQIVRTVLEIIESDGPDRVQLREVARRTHVSLSRVYAMFESRDDLIVAAMLTWMSEHAYSRLDPIQATGAHRRLMHVLRAVFEPWERAPRMLEAFHQARTSPKGSPLIEQGRAALGPSIRLALEDASDSFVTDVETLLTNLLYAVFGRISDGEMTADEVLPMFDRLLTRFTDANIALK